MKTAIALVGMISGFLAGILVGATSRTITEALEAAKERAAAGTTEDGSPFTGSLPE